jgi:hypothetical protein
LNSEDCIYDIFIQGNNYYNAKTLFDRDDPSGIPLSINYTQLDGIDFEKRCDTFTDMIKEYERIFGEYEDLHISLDANLGRLQQALDGNFNGSPDIFRRRILKTELWDKAVSFAWVNENNEYGSLGRAYNSGSWFNNFNLFMLFARNVSADNNPNSSELHSLALMKAAAEVILAILNETSDIMESDSVYNLARSYNGVYGYARAVSSFYLSSPAGGRASSVIGIKDTDITGSSTDNNTWSKQAILMQLDGGDEVDKHNMESLDLKLVDNAGKATISPFQSDVRALLIKVFEECSLPHENELLTLHSLFGNVKTNMTELKKRVNELIDALNELKKQLNLDEDVDVDAKIAQLNEVAEHVDTIFRLINESRINEDTDDYLLRQKAFNTAEGLRGAFVEISRKWDYLKTLEKIVDLALMEKSDVNPIDIDTLFHILVIPTDDGRAYYSDIGTFNIQALNFRSAEYADSIPREISRIGNRFALFTNNTVEFWDITNDWENPFAPAYQSKVYSMSLLPNSKVRFNDMLHFIAKPIELDAYSIYSLTKDGQLAQISYPQLDGWLNKAIADGHKDIAGSVVSYEHVPIIQWKISMNSKVLNFNAMHNAFFFSDNIYFYAGNMYFQHGSSKAGALDSFLDEEGIMIKCKILSPNSNFNDQSNKKRFKTVAMLHGDIEIEDSNEPKRITHKFMRISGMNRIAKRDIIIKPNAGKRNALYRIAGIGMGVDFQTEISWDGYLRINNLSYELE